MEGDYYHLIGVMMEVAWRGRGYSGLTLDQLMPRIYRAATNGCVIITGGQGGPFAFVTFSFFSEAEHQKLLADPGYVPPIDAWTHEGGPDSHFWVMDVIAPDEGHVPVLIDALKTHVPRPNPEVNWWRIKRGEPPIVLVQREVRNG